MKLIRRPKFWVISILLLFLASILSQFWVPVYVVPLDPEVKSVIALYFAAAVTKDVATVQSLEIPDHSSTDASILFALEQLAPFYAVNDIEFKEPYYIMLRTLGRYLWVDCTGMYDEGKEWDFSVLLLKTEDGWKISKIYPKSEQRVPQ